MKRALGSAVVALTLLAGAPHAPASARPFTVEDLLRQASFGAVAMDPCGRWVVFEERGPYADAPRFDDDQGNPLGASRLFFADRDGAGPATPLLPGEASGQLIAAVSPSGARLAVYQVRDGDWRIGVVDLATRTVRWLEVRSPKPHRGRLVQWRSDRELLVVDRAGAALATSDRTGRVSAEELPRLWAESAAGRGAHTVVGSGAYRDVRVRPPPARLLRIQVDQGVVSEIARGDIVDFELSPDGRRVAYRVLGDDIQSRPGRAVQGDWGVGPRVEVLRIADLATGRDWSPCPGCDVLPSLMAWSPSGAGLLFYGREGDVPWSVGRLRRYDLRADRLTAMPEDVVQPVVLGRPEIVRAEWMGETPIVIARPRADPNGRADWYRWSGAAPVKLTGSLPAAAATLATLDATGFTLLVGGQAWSVRADGHVRRLPVAGAVLITGAGKTRDGRPLASPRAQGWVARGTAGDRKVEAIGAPSAPAVKAPSEAIVEAANAGGAVIRFDAKGLETRLEWRRAKAPRVLADLNGGLADTDALDIRVVRHLGPEGQPLTSWLYLPPRRDGPPPPLLVKVYSGDTYREPPPFKGPVLGLMGDTRVLLGQGYAVLAPSLPQPKRGAGSPAEPARGLADRILAIVDAAARDPGTAGTFDPGRLALWGHSYGGYTVMAAITQTNRFRAAVAVGGYADLVSKWSALPVTHRVLQDEGVWSNYVTGGMESGQGGMGVPPWTDPARYMRNSPLLHADAIQTPLLLAHGDQDGVVPLTQSEAIFSALYRQGKDAELVTYWGEGHYISSPGNVRDLYARVQQFLDAHLGPAATPGAATLPRPARAPASDGPRPPPGPR